MDIDQGPTSVDDAMTFVLQRARPITDTEVVAVGQAIGRVAAADIESPIDVPGYDNSAMDGYAVRSVDLADAGSKTLRVTQRIAAGQLGGRLGPGEAARIFTGAPLPEGADAVVIQENCASDEGIVTTVGPIGPGEWVRPRGNDIEAGQCVVAAGVRLRPQEMGLIASVGVGEVEVVRRLRVAIFSSGDELLQPGEALRPGAIYNSNRYILFGLLAGLGCECLDLGTVEDSFATTRQALLDGAAQADLVVSSGGMSVGEEDHIKAAVEEAGKLEMWKVAVKPGKPLAYGRVGAADFVGLPGNPVSTLVTFCLFVRPFILARMGVVNPQPGSYLVKAGFDWPKPVSRREYVRVKVGIDERGQAVANLFPRQGSDVLTSTVWATGLMEIVEGETYRRGDSLRYIPFAEVL